MCQEGVGDEAHPFPRKPMTSEDSIRVPPKKKLQRKTDLTLEKLLRENREDVVSVREHVLNVSVLQ